MAIEWWFTIVESVETHQKNKSKLSNSKTSVFFLGSLQHFHSEAFGIHSTPLG